MYLRIMQYANDDAKYDLLQLMYKEMGSGKKDKGQCLSFLRSQFVLQLAGRIRSGIVDLTLLRGILAKGVNKNRALIADPASLAWLTDALKRVHPF